MKERPVMPANELKPGYVYIDVYRGPEGCCLCISDGETGERVAGPKPWGGSTNVHSFQVKADDLIRLANGYAKQDSEETQHG